MCEYVVYLISGDLFHLLLVCYLQGITIKPLVNFLKVKKADKRMPSMNEQINERVSCALPKKDPPGKIIKYVDLVSLTAILVTNETLCSVFTFAVLCNLYAK